MDQKERSLLPQCLRPRAEDAFDQDAQDPATTKWVALTYNRVLLIQEGILYFAGLAVAEYRGMAKVPDLKAEMAIASLGMRASLESYSGLLRPCIEATGKRSALSPLLSANFPSIYKLTALIEAAESQTQQFDTLLHNLIEKHRHDPPPDFDDFLGLVAKFRNRGFAHTDWHRFDIAKDFFYQTALVLDEVAIEFLTHPDVKAGWTKLRPATVTSMIQHEDGVRYLVRVIDDGSELEVEQARDTVKTSPLQNGEKVLIRNGRPSKMIGRYQALQEGMRDVAPTIEKTIYAILEAEGPGAALAALHGFAHRVKDNDGLRKLWMSPPLVDDVIVSALQHFKFNGENNDEGIPKRVYSLLEFTSPNLPRRILRDADRFEGVAVRYPKERQSSDDRSKRPRRGSLEACRREVIDLGFKNDDKSLTRLTKLAGANERRVLRMEALLALGKRKDPNSIELLREVANEHKSDAKIASCALIALASINDPDSIKFLVDYVTGDAPYACTDACAWALAAHAGEQPGMVSRWRDPLLKLAMSADGDPYTRGTVIYCLSRLQDPQLADDIASLIREDEDAFVVEDACAALAQLGDPRSVAPLAGALECTEGALADLCVKREAIRSLGLLGGDEARRALEAYECPEGITFVRRVLDGALASLGVGPDDPDLSPLVSA